MLTPDEFVNDLLCHAEQPYNPQKAHEYYVLNRELKGRKVGSAIPLTSVQRQEEVNKRVETLQKNLDGLKTELQERLDAAKAKEEKKNEPGKKEEEKKEEKKTGPDKKSDLTEVQKKKAAVKSKEYYEEHKFDKLSVDEIRGEIKKIEQQLKAAIAQAKSMMPVQSKTSQSKSSQQNKPQPKKSVPKKPGQSKPIPSKVSQMKPSEVKPTGNVLTRITDWVNTLFR